MASETQATRMFAAIRRIKLKPGVVDEYTSRVKAGAVPVLRRLDGFKAFYVVVSADDTVTSLSLFTNKEVDEASTATLMPWIKENLGPLLASFPEAIDGELVISEVQ